MANRPAATVKRDKKRFANDMILSYLPGRAGPCVGISMRKGPACGNAKKAVLQINFNALLAVLPTPPKRLVSRLHAFGPADPAQAARKPWERFMPVRFPNGVSIAGFAGAFMTAACAGGGGGGHLASSIPAAPATSSNTMTPGTGGSASSANANTTASGILGDTGWSGSVAAPAPASFGISPSPAQIAAPNGPVFWDLPQVAMVFPALSSSLQLGPTGLSAASNQAATVTLTATNTSSFNGETNTVAQLSIPSVNVNVTWTTPDLNGWYDDYRTVGLRYTLLGSWEAHAKLPADNTGEASGPLQSVTWFSVGYETPAAATPTSGQASFAAWAKGSVFTPIDGHIAKFDVYGPGTLLADFATGKITGGLSKMTAYGRIGPSGPWNDVSISASIAAGTNRFSGTTAVTSAPQNILSLKGSATGAINGAFYGPAAENLGRIWTLSDGTSSALGGVAAGR